MNKLSASELHTIHPYDPDEQSWSWRCPTPFEDAVAMADELHLQDDPLTYLESIEDEDRSRASAINSALLFLPPEVVLENYGEEVAVWSSLSAFMQGENDEMNATLQDKAGYNIEDLKIARGWTWRNGPLISSVKRQIGLYGLMQAVKADALENIDLSDLLIDNAKDGVTLDKKRLESYALEPIAADAYNSYYNGGRVHRWTKPSDKNEVIYPIWIDAPTGFALTYKGAPNAVTALSMPDTDEIMINQLQGVRGERVDLTKSIYDTSRVIGAVSSRGLAPLDWHGVMVGATEQLATNLDIPKTGIQAAANNVWTKKRGNDDEPHLSIETAEHIYDKTAERLGYVKSSDRDTNWHKPLTP